MITVENISVIAGRKNILKDVSLNIPSGKLSVLVGKNGAGKSTLLRTITGDIEPDHGTILYGDSLFDRRNPTKLAKSRAVVLQSSRLAFSFTTLEVVLMGRIPHSKGFASANDHRIARRCMQKMQVLDLKDRSYPTLSGGEQQRVQLARALAQIWDHWQHNNDAPCYLLLDEPTSSLDIAHQQLLLSMLKELAVDGVTVLAVLHDLNLAAQYGDIISVLKDGELLATGHASKIIRPDLIKHAFECQVRVLHNPHWNCPLVVAENLNGHNNVVLSNKFS